MFVNANAKKSVFIVSGLLKGESSRIRNLKIVGILLAFTSGIAAVILISTQSQGSVTQNAVETHYNPLLDPNCSNCTCFAYIDLVLDATTDLTADAFKMQNEFVNYYISRLFDPQLLEKDSPVIINYGIDGGNFGTKWPNIFDRDSRTLHEYFKDGDILKKRQKPGKFNDLYNILVGIFLNDVFDCFSNELFDCYSDSLLQNNIVFMGSPSTTAPPNTTFDLTLLPDKTYNGTKEINLIKHYFHRRNSFIVILMKDDTYEKWNKTNLQQWLDAGLHVLQYKNDSGQLLYDLRKQLSCVPSYNQTYINLPEITETLFSNVKFTTKAISNVFTISESSSTRQNTIHQSSTKKQN